MSSMKKTSQAALEFLTTYAWAFLVILIMIGALAYFGILSPSKLLPDRCNFGSEISCMNYKIAKYGLQIKLKNGIGSTVVIDDLIVSTKDNSDICQSPSIVDKTWESGGVKDMSVLCDFTDTGIVGGEKGKLDVEIRYHTASASSTFSKSVQGELFGDVESGIGLIGSGSGLVGYWKFQEGSGIIAADSSENTNNGDLTNFDCTTLDCDAESGWVSSGKKGKALSFDGVDDYTSMSHDDSIDFTTNEDFSVSVWYVRRPDAITNQRLLSKGGGSSFQVGYNFFVADTRITWGVSNGGGGGDGVDRILVSSGNIHETGTWIHVVGIREGGSISIYTNGVLRDSDSSFTGNPSNTGQDLHIGKRSDGNSLHFTGNIDEVMIYDRALSESEILALYKS